MGNAFGLGWTGMSGRGEDRKRAPKWVEEQVDLTSFAGKEILLRFEMVTDDAVNQPGLLLDNIAIPEIGYQDDGETGAGGWEAERLDPDRQQPGATLAGAAPGSWRWRSHGAADGCRARRPRSAHRAEPG